MGKALLTLQVPDREVRVELLTPESYARHWPDVSKQLDFIEPLWSSWYTKEFFRSCQFNGVMIWGFGPPHQLELVAYTQIIRYPSTQVYQFMFAFGNNLDVMLPYMEAFFTKIAHDNDCKEFEIVGREGWGRKFKNARRIASIFRCPVPKFGVH